LFAEYFLYTICTTLYTTLYIEEKTMPEKNRPVTIKEVARIAGVSIKTVSNVVNDWPYVSEETRQKVLDVIREVGYRPNYSARSLVTGKTKTIGVIIPDISNPFFGMAIRGCEDLLFQKEYSLVLCNTNEDINRERFNLELLMSRGVDALIVWGARNECTKIEEYTGDQIPLVTVDLPGCPLSGNHTGVTVNSQEGAFEAVRHLIDLGCRRIGHLEGPDIRMTAQRRVNGYRQALESAGIPYDPNLLVSDAPSIRGGFRAAMEILTSRKPDAIFCYNDLMAVGALVAAREKKINVPQDLMVCGFDDITMASMTEPPLTTIRINQYKLGHLTGRLVLDRLEKKIEGPQAISFPVALQVRGSTNRNSFGNEERISILENLISSLTADDPDRILSDHTPTPGEFNEI